MNSAVKVLCNKIQDIKVEVRELNSEKLEEKKNPCKSCNCTKLNDHAKNAVKTIEDKIGVMKEAPYDSEIVRIKEF